MISIMIIGNGPAGISAGIYAKRTGLDVTIIGKDSGALQKADKVENYYGFSEPIKGVDLVLNGIKQAKRLGITIINEEVISIEFNEDYIIKTDKNEYMAKAVVLATGSPRQVPKIAGIKEYEGKGVSYCAVCDAFFYKGKNVAVLGCCDYAMNEARELLNVANSVTIITDGVLPKGNIPKEAKVIEKQVARIQGDIVVQSVIFKDDSELKIDGLFIAYGVAGSSEFALKLGVLMENNRIIVNENMETNLPGLFAAGDCIGGIYQIAKAVYDGSRAGMASSKYVRLISTVK